MQMETNEFEKALKAQQKQIGLWVSLCSPIAAGVVAHAGYDWAVVDMEHTANDYMSVLHQLQVFAASNTTAIVRPEWNDPVVVKRLMDIGVQGLLFPMIGSVEEAKKAVAATRYPPKGMRGVAGVTRANKFGRVTDYVDRVEAETTIILQLESADAIAQAEQIAAVDGVSGIFFGPADIAADIGAAGGALDPAVWELVLPAAEKLIAMGMPVGTLVTDPKFATELLHKGFTFVACGLDTLMLARAADAVLAQVKGEL
ncbi:HpcH/HpaI aldolase family protein [Yoonia sediminilitoris]|uniref:4-hydroxy-2-oxoheptanedioate aldolase n=1 Tax=Yoonia sediminilitoris TaxID=1286148 RepID=A0A2T6KI64_9RHOB|nr:aldolase/citrate lyase family protein [Yoonia sediminilitoris]PUB15422.1 4-hydroxy-2-oxoheptanedioate aldolase [Yoonia sediminilitoris]RCW96032.1 4-hydroxy-2-oxoheptanedioate aldolase [Yoonia sediminilitoris]